jgi:pyruvate dehydrogenase E2 component (dihydrolipoamide acetyltransferase)
LTEFKVPELGENVTTGDVLRVLVSVGDTIEKDQPVLELETDKATIEVPSSVGGVVKDVRVKQGDKVTVGSVILTVEGNRADATGVAKEVAGGFPPSHEASADHRSLGAGGQASGGQPGPKPGQKVVSMPRPGRPEPAPTVAISPAEAKGPVATPSRAVRGPAAPAAPGLRRLAREIGVDINEVQGSGPGGRITEEDVKEHARNLLSGARAPGSTGAGRSVPLPDFERWGEIERQPMTNVRRTTAQRLGHAWNTIPHVTQFDKADITSVEELRRKYRDQVRQAGGDLTVTAILVKVLAVAIRQFPQFNASIDPEAEQIIYKKYVNIGIAVDTDRGLLVPVVRNAHQKNLTQIAIEVQQLAQKARDRKLTLEEMSGGSMTISNLGGIGGTYFTPIINWPEVAILGVSRGIIEPVWRPSTREPHPSASLGTTLSSPKGQGRPEPGRTAGGVEARDGAFEPRQLLPLSLSYDHRIIDGADAMRFLRWVVEAVEQPFLLALFG